MQVVLGNYIRNVLGKNFEGWDLKVRLIAAYYLIRLSNGRNRSCKIFACHLLNILFDSITYYALIPSNVRENKMNKILIVKLLWHAKRITHTLTLAPVDTQPESKIVLNLHNVNHTQNQQKQRQKNKSTSRRKKETKQRFF